MKVALAQLNFTVGDIEGNQEKIINAIIAARDHKQADLVLFPELALSGYPPEDYLLRSDFISACDNALQRITQATQRITVILGHPHREKNGLYNAASVLQNQRSLGIYHKQCLPNYGVFDEKRYFTEGKIPFVIPLNGLQVGLLICEDLWEPEPIQATIQAGANLIISLNASPFDHNKSSQRQAHIAAHARNNNIPIIYMQSIGGQDELVFDGGSFAVNRSGEIYHQSPYFTESLTTLDTKQTTPGPSTPPRTFESQCYQALVLGLRDYIQKNGLTEGLIGLSGGIDSALTLCIAVDALGAEHVEAILLPSRYTSSMSLETATTLAENLQVTYQTLSIEPSLRTLFEILQLDPKDTSITHQNLQARCRGLLLMAHSNRSNKLVLSTSNKSELAMGYTTLYGDMIGALGVLKDLYKTEVYRLARYRNQLSPVIPKHILTRAPSAELAPDQTDQDSLPPYELLDPILKAYLEDQATVETLAADHPATLVQQVLTQLHHNEYKRRQAPIGIRITQRAFGRDWRYPITKKYNDA